MKKKIRPPCQQPMSERPELLAGSLFALGIVGACVFVAFTEARWLTTPATIGCFLGGIGALVLGRL